MRKRAAPFLFLLLSACAAPPKRLPLVAAYVPAPLRAAHRPTPALEAHIPPFARDPYESFSRAAAVAVAKAAWRAFYQPVVLPHTPLPHDEERAQGLWQLVGLYWWIGLDPSWFESRFTGKHDAEGRLFPKSENGDYAWSAAFISYVMRMAGAASKFPYSPTHSDYINAARLHAMGEFPGLAITSERPSLYAPRIGDLICEWRAGVRVTYDDLPTPYRFPGHCDIVVAKEPGLLDVIGGNVDNAVAMRQIPVTADGRLAYPDGRLVDPDYHWFVVIRVDYNERGPSASDALPRSAQRTSRPRPPIRIAQAREGSRKRARR